jgi:endothelin-converting enzyme
MSQAYKTWFERYQSDLQSTKYNNKRLPGLEEYSPEQMFFIQYARGWCGKPNPNKYERALKDVHSPDKWRIVGVLQNSQDFASAFKCELGSRMNPRKTKDNDTKCDVW